MQATTLLDTDVLSALMRRSPLAMTHARRYLADHTRLTMSLITRFEILRGLKAKRATSQLVAFETFCVHNDVMPVTDAVVVRAADIYADLHARGALIPDADILIAATAIEHSMTLATNNLSDFGRITGLRIDNWLTPL